jgi:hypothetical protein
MGMSKRKKTRQIVTTESFEKLSKSIVARFLQTVVVVDDQAFLSETDSVQPHGELISPALGRRQTDSVTTENHDTIEDSTHKLNAKKLIDAFAEKGIVCGVLRPKLNELYETKTIKAAERADIILLDWQLQGTTLPDIVASDLITKIISGGNSQDRIRLIAIYSIENPSTIRPKIEASLNSVGPTSIEDDGNTFILKANRICLFAKEGTIGSQADRIVREEDLPNRLIDEFAKMTIGLLSNTALESLAVIRSNTHRILGKFQAGLDAPYLSHRILNDPPEEAETHIVPLMASEIQSVLDDSKISELVNIDRIESWLEWHSSNKPLYRRMHIKSKTSEADAKKVLLNLLTKGVNNDNSSHKFKKWNKLVQLIKEEKDKQSPSRLTDVLTIDGKSGEIWDKELALLMSTKSRYFSPSPVLTLGTIIAEDTADSTKYYVCIQPRCDCLRLPAKGREFTFLPLVPVSAASSDFSHVIRDKSQIIDLQLSIKLHESRKIQLEPSKRGYPVYASSNGNNWIFTSSVVTTNVLRWIAELKSEHAQRIANDFAREISRVGLTESEWLRRCAKKS